MNRRRPYRTPTYSQVADASRITPCCQAMLYADWLKQHPEVKTIYLYPTRKTDTAVSNVTRRALEERLGNFQSYTIEEIDPSHLERQANDTD